MSLDLPLLFRLRAAAGAFLTPAELGGGADLDRGLAELERFGFVIERHPCLGIAYRGPSDRLCPDLIEHELGTRRVGRRVAVWSRVASTNDVAAAAAGSVANDGLVVLAEEQTAGRGRRGRSWTAPPRSSVLMSVLLFPPAVLVDPGWLTALGAVATAEVVEQFTGREARLKWPNDVRVDCRKVAGVLVERGAGSVVGIGLNANLAADDLPEILRPTATSVQILAGGAVDRSELAKALIRRLDHHYGDGLDAGPEPLVGRWRSRLELLGRVVRVETAAGPVVGQLVDADLRHGLTIAPAGGPPHVLPGADVRAVSACDGAPDGDGPAI